MSKNMRWTRNQAGRRLSELGHSSMLESKVELSAAWSQSNTCRVANVKITRANLDT